MRQLAEKTSRAQKQFKEVFTHVLLNHTKYCKYDVCADFEQKNMSKLETNAKMM